MKTLERALEVEAAKIALRSVVRGTSDDVKAHITSCCLELFRTEKNYLAKLRIVTSEFHRRLRAQLTFDESEFPDRAEANYDVMFEYAQGFVECHDDLWFEMKTAVKASRFFHSLDDIFTKFIGKSREKYIEYALSYPDVANLLSKHQRSNHRFNEFVFVSEICAGESINSLRMAPIQRSRQLPFCAKPLESYG